MVKILGWKCTFVSPEHSAWTNVAEESNLPSQITEKGLQKGPEGSLVPMTVDKHSHNVNVSHNVRTSTT